MTEQATPKKPVSFMMNALNWAYDQAASSIPGIDNAEQLARHHLERCDNEADRAIDDLIAWQVRYAGAAGFISNLGGVITLPVSIPANLASVLLIQLRMIAAIAHIRGYKVEDPAVRTMAFLCLTGNGGVSILRGASVGLGTRMSARVISHLSSTALGRINQAVGAKLAAAAGVRGLVSVGRILPIVGGVIGGGFDAVATRGIAMAARRFFTAKPDETLDDFIPAGQALSVADETMRGSRRLSGPGRS